MPTFSNCHLDFRCMESSFQNALEIKRIARLVGVDASSDMIGYVHTLMVDILTWVMVGSLVPTDHTR